MNLGLFQASIDVDNNRLQKAVAKALGHVVSGGNSAATEEISRQLLSTRGTSETQIEDTLRNMNVQVGELTKRVHFTEQTPSNGTIESLNKQVALLRNKLSASRTASGVTDSQKSEIERLEKEVFDLTQKLEKVQSDHKITIDKLQNELREAKKATLTAKSEGEQKLREAQDALRANTVSSNSQTMRNLKVCTDQLKLAEERLASYIKNSETLEAKLAEATKDNMSEDERKEFKQVLEDQQSLRDEEIKVILANRVNTHPPLRKMTLDDEVIEDDTEENKFYGDLENHEFNNVKLDPNRPTRLAKVNRSIVTRWALNDKEVVWYVSKDQLENEKSAAEAERVALEEAERVDREEAERVARERAERVSREEAERVDREEAERVDREETERVAREEAERVSREEADREQAAREQAEREQVEATSAETGDVDPEILDQIGEYFREKMNKLENPSRRQLAHTYGTSFFVAPRDENKLIQKKDYERLSREFIAGSVTVNVSGTRTVIPMTKDGVTNMLKKTYDAFQVWMTEQGNDDDGQPLWPAFTVMETAYLLLYIVHLQGFQNTDGTPIISKNSPLIGNSEASYVPSPFSSMFMWM